eukprot:SAG22_NODE_21006_length_260_cov_1.583851_1_plen_28_part_10
MQRELVNGHDSWCRTVSTPRTIRSPVPG